jgi:hypothetical protein
MFFQWKAPSRAFAKLFSYFRLMLFEVVVHANVLVYIQLEVVQFV